MEQEARNTNSDLLNIFCGLISSGSEISTNNANLQQSSATNNQGNFVATGSNCAETTQSLPSQSRPMAQGSSGNAYPMPMSSNGKPPSQPLLHMSNNHGNAITEADFAEIERISSDIIQHDFPPNSLLPIAENSPVAGNMARLKSNTSQPVNVNNIPFNNNNPLLGNSIAHNQTPQSQAQAAILEAAISSMEKDNTYNSAASNFMQTFTTFLHQQQQQQQQQSQQNDNSCHWQQQQHNPGAQNINNPGHISGHSGNTMPNGQVINHENYNRIISDHQHINNMQQVNMSQGHSQMDYNGANVSSTQQNNMVNNRLQQSIPQDNQKSFSNLGTSNLRTINMQEFIRTNLQMQANNNMSTNAGHAYMKTGYANLRHMDPNNIPKTQQHQMHGINAINEESFNQDRPKEKKLTTTPIPSDAEKASTSSGSGPETSPHHFGDQVEVLPSHANNVFEMEFSPDSSRLYNSRQQCANNPLPRNNKSNKDFVNCGNVNYNSNTVTGTHVHNNSLQRNDNSTNMMNLMGTVSSSNLTLDTANRMTNTHSKNTTVSNQHHDNASYCTNPPANSDNMNKTYGTSNLMPDSQIMRHNSNSFSNQSLANKEVFNCLEKQKQTGLLTQKGSLNMSLSANHNNNANVKPINQQETSQSRNLTGKIDTNNNNLPQTSYVNSVSNNNPDGIERGKQKKSKRNKVANKNSKYPDNVPSESSFVPRLNVQVTSMIPKATADPISKSKSYALVQDQISHEQTKNKDGRKHSKKSKNMKKTMPQMPSSMQQHVSNLMNNNTNLATKDNLSVPKSNPPSNQPQGVVDNKNNGSNGIRQWQTVTAVQGPKLPPMLSEQDRIPKRGRPPKKMVQQNLRVNKDNSKAAPAVPEKVVPVPSRVVTNTPVSSNLPSNSKLVSMYTINDKGFMEEITPKLKENKRSKERSVAFLNYLNEIRSSQKHKFGESCATPNNNNTTKSKPRKKSKPRTKVFGKSTAPLTLSGFNETMCTFSELAQQYKISNSILSRATENLRKSAAASVAKHQFNSLQQNGGNNANKAKETHVPVSSSMPVGSVTSKTVSITTTSTTSMPVVSTWSNNQIQNVAKHPSRTLVAPKTVVTTVSVPTNVQGMNSQPLINKSLGATEQSSPVKNTVTPVASVKQNNNYQEKLKIKPKKKKKKNKKKLIVETHSMSKKKKKESKKGDKLSSHLHKSDLVLPGQKLDKTDQQGKDNDATSSSGQPEDQAYDACDSLSESESSTVVGKNTYKDIPVAISTVISSVSNNLFTATAQSGSNLSFKTAIFPAQSPFQDARENLVLQSKTGKEDPKPIEDISFSSSTMRKKHQKHKKKKLPRKSKGNLDPQFLAVMEKLMETFTSTLKINKSLPAYEMNSKNKLADSIKNNIFSVQKSPKSSNKDALWQRSKQGVSENNKTPTRSTAYKFSTVKPVNSTSSSTQHDKNNVKNISVLKSSISSKKSQHDNNQPSLTLMSALCTSPFYQKYGYVAAKSVPPEVASGIGTPEPKTKESRSKTTSKSDVNITTIIDNKHTSQDMSSSKKRKRGRPLGKKRGSKKKSRLSSDQDESDLESSSVASPSSVLNDDKDATVKKSVSEKLEINKRNSVKLQNNSSETNKQKENVSLLENVINNSKTKNQPKHSHNSDKKSENDNNQPNMEQIKSQIQRAIQASLSAMPNINADEITKTVNAAISNYMVNTKNSANIGETVGASNSGEMSSSKEDVVASRSNSSRSRHKRNRNKTSHEDKNNQEFTDVDLSKAIKSNDKHPKKVWAWKHKDSSLEVSNDGTSNRKNTQDNGQNESQAPKKRMPGRPRKHPLTPRPYDETEISSDTPSKKRKLSKNKEKSIPQSSTPDSQTKITVHFAKRATQTVLNISAAQKYMSKSKYKNTDPGPYDGTKIGVHIMDAINSAVQFGLDEVKRCSEEENNSSMIEDCLRQGEKASITAKKSLESVVEKLKSKQAQSLQNAAVALLQLQQSTPSTSDDFSVSSSHKSPEEMEVLKRTARRILAKKKKKQDRINKILQAKRLQRGQLTGNNIGKVKQRGRPKKINASKSETENISFLHSTKSSTSGRKRGRRKKFVMSNEDQSVFDAKKKNLLEKDILPIIIPSVLPEKSFLHAGLFSNDFKNDDTVTLSEADKTETDLPSDILPPPLHAGLYIRGSLQDFQLPYDIWWLYRKRKISSSQDPSTHFQVITQNTYCGIKPVIDTEDHICECTIPVDDTDEPACSKHCLNRAVYTECNSQTCPCGERCSNQSMQRKQWCKSLERFKTKDKGWGIRANSLIKEGEFLLEYVGEVVSESEFRRRTMEHYQSCRDHYCVNLDNTRVIDGYRMGNEGRFVNHSCEPNCEMQKWLVAGEYRLGLFALRQLQPGEEITYDYNFHAYNINQQQKCRCGSLKCRGIINGKRHKVLQETEAKSSSEKPQTSIVKNSGSSIEQALWMVKPSQHLNTMGFECNSFKPISKDDQEFIQKAKLFLIRNLKQVHKANSSDALEDFPTTSIPKVSNKPIINRGTPNEVIQESEVDRSTKLKTVLDEIFEAIMNCEDENGNIVDVPTVKKNPEKESKSSDEEEDIIDFPTMKKNIAEDCYEDIESFGSDVMTTIKAIEKQYGKKSAEGRALSIMRKTYSNARSMADVLIADDFGGRRKSIRNAIRECEFADRKNEDFIRCICQIYKDEGVMVQCENCYVWQHCDCMGVKPDKVDKYLCEQCYPRRVPKEVRVIPQPSNAHPGHTYYITLLRDNLLVKQGDCVYLMRANHQHNNGATSRASYHTLEHTDDEQLDIFRIEKLWVDESGGKYAYGHHFLRPHETHHSPTRTFYRNELFVSPLDEIIPLDSIVRVCCVMDLYTYCKGKPKGLDMKDIYVCDFRVDKTARIFTRITKKRHVICTKPHVFDMYSVKLCPKKDFKPHHIPDQYKKISRQSSLSETSPTPNDEKLNSNVDDSKNAGEGSTKDEKPSDVTQLDGSAEEADGANKKKDRLNNIAKKLLSKLPRQAVDMSYLLEPGNGKRQRKKTLVSMESIGQQ